VDAPFASWSPRAERTRPAVVAIAATIVFAAVWATLHFGFYGRNRVVDTPVYQGYGDAIVNGQVPYSDFSVEYPPAALPVFAAPSLVVSPDASLADYERVFGFLMALCGAATIALVAYTLAREGTGAGRIAGACAFVALAPLALGSVLLTRFDLWPAALVAAALAALVAGRDRLALGVVALGVAAKVYPLVLLPIFVAWVWKRRGRREAGVALGVAVGVLVVCVVPFLALSPHGVWASSLRQTTRPLQIETLGSGVLLALHHAAGLGLTMVSNHGSQNLAGGAPDALAIVQSVVEIAVLVGIWRWFARGPAEPDRLFRACAAAVCAFVVFGKVLSPQYLVWLVPLVVLVGGRRGVIAAGILAACLVLTQIWFPYRYWQLALHFDAAASWLVLVRDLGLVALLAVLLWPRPRETPLPARSGHDRGQTPDVSAAAVGGTELA
jgi:Glycosyltransferase family 87